MRINGKSKRNRLITKMNHRSYCRAGNTLYTAAYLRIPGGEVRTKCRFHGLHPWRGSPIYFREVAAVHALEIARNTKVLGNTFGGSTLRSRLSASFAMGAWDLQSAAARRKAERRYTLARILPVPLAYYSFPSDQVEGEQVRECQDVGRSVLVVTSRRARTPAKGETLSEYAANIPRAPLTQDGLKEQTKTRNEVNELKILRLMGAAGSVVTRRYSELRVTCSIVALAKDELAGARALHLLPCDILRAARFKCIKGERLLGLTCCKCGAGDSLAT